MTRSIIAKKPEIKRINPSVEVIFSEETRRFGPLP